MTFCSKISLFLILVFASLSIRTRTIAAQETPDNIIIESFNIIGNTQGSSVTLQEIETILFDYLNRPVSIFELFEAKNTITKLYAEKGYITTKAYLKPQEIENNIVTIEIVEGGLEAIEISGNKRLNEKYIRDRLEPYTKTPINSNKILEGLQLLRINPLVETISAELSQGVELGADLLEVEIVEADVFELRIKTDNTRSPIVGTFRRGIELEHLNLLGLGDRAFLAYFNTQGSNTIDAFYSIPLNAKDATLKFSYGAGWNELVVEPFDILDIETRSRYFDIEYRQPIIKTSSEELTLGVDFFHQSNKTTLLGEPFPITIGADINGNTKISVVRLFQEYLRRDENRVIALRSQFSLGVNLLEATVNEDEPDSLFLAWRGQAQWIEVLDRDILLIVRGSTQLTNTSLLPSEQFRIGGANTVRGYSEDLRLGDNGVNGSVELEIPIARLRKIDSKLFVIPFFDAGVVWNDRSNAIALSVRESAIASIGVGLKLEIGKRGNARVDWGIPLINVEREQDSLQESGVHFSFELNF